MPGEYLWFQHQPDSALQLSLLSVPGLGDDEQALTDLGAYGQESDGVFSLLPGDAWVHFEYANSTLTVRVHDGQHDNQVILTRRMKVSPVEFKKLSDSVLVYVYPEVCSTQDFQQRLERGEYNDWPLEIGVQDA